jgi:hypothetical protein
MSLPEHTFRRVVRYEPDPCPECKGRCCRDVDTGYRHAHADAAIHMHDCDACFDGTVPPPWTTPPSARAIAYMDEYADEYLRLEPRESYDPCIVGVARRFNDTVLVYSLRAIRDMHVRDGMTPEEAEEYVEVNTLGAWMGDKTPIFLLDLDGACGGSHD